MKPNIDAPDVKPKFPSRLKAKTALWTPERLQCSVKLLAYIDYIWLFETFSMLIVRSIDRVAF